MLHTQVDLKHFLVHVQTRDGTQGTVFTCADEGWKSIFICYVTCANEGETQCNIHLSCNFDVKLVQIRSERQYMQYSFVMQLVQMRSETVQLCNLCKWGVKQCSYATCTNEGWNSVPVHSIPLHSASAVGFLVSRSLTDPSSSATDSKLPWRPSAWKKPSSQLLGLWWRDNPHNCRSGCTDLWVAYNLKGRKAEYSIFNSQCHYKWMD